MTSLRMCLLLLVVFLPMSGGQAFNSFFKLGPLTNTASHVWGVICFNYKEFTPTCRWEIMLSASVNLTGVTVDGVTIRRQAPHIFILGSTLCNKNLSTQPADMCMRATLFGTFPTTTKPIVYAVLKSYCIATSRGLKNVSTTYSPYIGQTFHHDPFYFNTTSSASSSLPSMLGYCPEFESVMSKGCLLEPRGNICYTGQHKVTFSKIFSANECVTLCGFYPQCLGVNVKPDLRECDVIAEDPDLNAGQTSVLPGCAYWKMTNRTL